MTKFQRHGQSGGRSRSSVGGGQADAGAETELYGQGARLPEFKEISSTRVLAKSLEEAFGAAGFENIRVRMRTLDRSVELLGTAPLDCLDAINAILANFRERSVGLQIHDKWCTQNSGDGGPQILFTGGLHFP